MLAGGGGSERIRLLAGGTTIEVSLQDKVSRASRVHCNVDFLLKSC